MPASSARSKSKASAAKTPTTLFGPGDFVTNPLKPEWGPGRVVDLKRDVVFVYFRDRPGKEVIRMKQSGLRPGERDPELEAISGYVETSSGFALEKKKAGGKARKNARPVIVFDDPVDTDDVQLPDDAEMEEELLDEE